MRTVIAGCTLLLLLAGIVAAQETETEREAGRDVVRQIHQLDQSLNVSQIVARLTAPDKGRDQVIASLEVGHRFPRDRPLLLLETRVLMIEMAAGVGEDSALWQETLIRQQSLPCFLNALRQLLVSGSA